jgi:hypothetical protein
MGIGVCNAFSRERLYLLAAGLYSRVGIAGAGEKSGQK